MYLTRDHATKYLNEKGVPMGPLGLCNLASKERGPKYALINGRALYTTEWLDKWLEEQAANSPTPLHAKNAKATSDAPAILPPTKQVGKKNAKARARRR